MYWCTSFFKVHQPERSSPTSNSSQIRAQKRVHFAWSSEWSFNVSFLTELPKVAPLSVTKIVECKIRVLKPTAWPLFFLVDLQSPAKCHFLFRRSIPLLWLVISIFLAIVATQDIQHYHQQYLLCLVKGYGLFPPKNLKSRCLLFPKKEIWSWLGDMRDGSARDFD